MNALTQHLADMLASFRAATPDRMRALGIDDPATIEQALDYAKRMHEEQLAEQLAQFELLLTADLIQAH